MRFVAAILAFACIAYQQGACCGYEHCGPRWFGLSLATACQASESEQCRDCIGYGHDEPSPTEEGSPEPGPIHLCAGSHVFYLSGGSFRAADRGEVDWRYVAMHQDAVEFVQRTCLCGVESIRPIPIELATLPLRAELGVFQI